MIVHDHRAQILQVQVAEATGREGGVEAGGGGVEAGGGGGGGGGGAAAGVEEVEARREGMKARGGEG